MILLFLGAKKRNRPGAKPLHRKGKISQPVMARQGLAGQAKGAHIQFFLANAAAECMGPTSPPRAPSEPAITASGIRIAVIYIPSGPQLPKASRSSLP